MTTTVVQARKKKNPVKSGITVELGYSDLG
jgi:hypothetical protein